MTGYPTHFYGKHTYFSHYLKHSHLHCCWYSHCIDDSQLSALGNCPTNRGLLCICMCASPVCNFPPWLFGGAFGWGHVHLWGHKVTQGQIRVSLRWWTGVVLFKSGVVSDRVTLKPDKGRWIFTSYIYIYIYDTSNTQTAGVTVRLLGLACMHRFTSCKTYLIMWASSGFSLG